jgi:hypothetical protein
MSQWQRGIDLVSVTPPNPFSLDISCVLEVGHYLPGGALGDADRLRYL